MDTPNYSIEISLVDDKVKLQGVSATNPAQPITFDYIPPIGSGEGFAGLELLTACFAGCVSTAVLFLLRRGGAEVKEYKAYVSGFRRENPLALSNIIYKAELISPNTSKEQITAVLEKARTMSPVWNSLNPDIVVEATCILR